MGWASGSELADEVWNIFEKFMPNEKVAKKTAQKLVDAFEDQDCDTMYECDFVEKYGLCQEDDDADIL